MYVQQLKYILFRYKYPTALVLSGGLLFFDQLTRIRKNINNITSTIVLTRQNPKSEYIYIQDETTEELLHKMEIRGITNEFYKIMQLFFWMSSKFKGSQLYEDVFSFHQNLAWRILRLAQDDNYYYRQRAIKILARMPSLSDLTCLQLAQACDSRTAVGIARTQNSDLRLLRNPPKWLKPVDNRHLLQKIHTILFKLNSENPHPCLQYVITQIFSETDHRSFLDDVGFYVKNPDIINKSLEALLHHSWLGSNTKSIVENGGLELMVDLYGKIEQDGGNVDCLIALSRILSNISMDPQFHKMLFMSGSVKILALLLRHSDIRVSVPAGRALLNCDVDAHKPNEPAVRFLRNIYSLHPIYRTQQSPAFDIVFVHGLLGGVFVTWRQRDIPIQKVASNGEELLTGITDLPIDSNLGSDCIENLRHRNAGKQNDKRTQCWPRDWLAQDCPNLRIIGVNYDTNISMWAPMCPIAPNRLTLSDRSANLTESLIAAGLGSRPIIWVAHSMGGLIVKHLLVKCSESSDIRKQNIVNNSKGIVMFSTPHKGSQLATLRPTSQYILWPTIEVQELRKNSSALLNLHEKFLELATSRSMSLLSFAERESTFVKALQLDLRFVESESSDPDIGQLYGLSLDHLTICKPAERDSFLYQKVLEFIEEIVSDTKR